MCNPIRMIAWPGWTPDEYAAAQDAKHIWRLLEVQGAFLAIGVVPPRPADRTDVADPAEPRAGGAALAPGGDDAA